MLYGGFYGRSTLGGTVPGMFESIVRSVGRKAAVFLRTVGSSFHLLTKNSRQSPPLTQRKDRTVL